MADDAKFLRWLPAHQLSVPLTLAHADATIKALCDLCFEHNKAGFATFGDVTDGDLVHTVVETVRPLPPAIPRLAADAFTQLRAALEHCFYAEVEHTLGRELDRDEQRCIEVPHCSSAKEFTQWLNQSRRKKLAPLRDGTETTNRLRRLQPYKRKDVEHHPLRVLAEHSNHAKHRMPLVTSVRTGRVSVETNGSAVLPAGSNLPLEVGTRIASAPKGQVAELAIWSQVALQRPHTDEWVVLIGELRDLADWVRTVAIPILITGEVQEDAPLPAHIDLSHPWEEPTDAVRSGSHVSAVQAHLQRIMAVSARESLVELTTQVAQGPSMSEARAWVTALSDQEALERVGRLHGADATQRTSISHLSDDQLRDRIRSMSVPPAVLAERIHVLAHEAKTWALT